ncbi:MAG TPA: hypothetical protein VGB81_11825, partial [Devosia sp.]
FVNHCRKWQPTANHKALKCRLTTNLRACAATPPIVESAELAQNTAMIIQIPSKKDSLGV